ncbi:MAG TPA: hypothetical protein VER17_09330 [Tepidisphaeraceae bacterium]|nr:hypothetical protein [Tepidisphaeraceae bacterium]
MRSITFLIVFSIIAILLTGCSYERHDHRHSSPRGRHEHRGGYYPSSRTDHYHGYRGRHHDHHRHPDRHDHHRGHYDGRHH